MASLFDLGYFLLVLATLPYWLYHLFVTRKYRAVIGPRLRCDLSLQKKWLSDERSTDRPVVWLHAVSVGEVLMLRPLVAQLQERHPRGRIVLSTTTSAGYQLARERFTPERVFLSPIDFSWSVRRTLDQLRPNLIVLAEVELWPNLLMEAKLRRIPVACVNARMSERSFPYYRRFRPILRPALSAIRWWGAQNASYAERIGELVDDASTVQVTGSMKYEGATTDRGNPAIRRLRELFGLTGDEFVLVAGSTVAPEESIVLDAFEELTRQDDRTRLLLVPRHPDRFEAVAQMLADRPLPFVRRSALSVGHKPLSAKIFLVDTLGELAHVWGLADAGFVGGSLECKRGGQSMIEPAALGVPVCFGPETWNFHATVQSLLEVKGCIQLADRDELFPTWRHWIDSPVLAHEMGSRARAFVLSQQGAVARTVDGLDRLLERAPPRSDVKPLHAA